MNTTFQKGQIWSYDMLISVITFMIALGAVAFFWWGVTSTVNEKPTQIFTEANLFAENLLSVGSPSNWESVIDTDDTETWLNVSSCGLLSSNTGMLVSRDKMVALREMNATNYTSLKEQFQLNYEFSVALYEFYNCSDDYIVNSNYNCTGKGFTPDGDEWNSSSHMVGVSGSNFSIGVEPDATAKTIARLSRFATYNDSLVMFKIVLWSNGTWH